MRSRQEIIYEACESIETGIEWYSCNAIKKVTQLSDCPLTYEYSEFYDQVPKEAWLNYADVDEFSEEEFSHLRVMLLLNFLEGSKYE